MVEPITYNVITPVVTVVKMETVDDLEWLLNKIKTGELRSSQSGSLSSLKLGKNRYNKDVLTYATYRSSYGDSVDKYDITLIALGDYAVWNQKNVFHTVNSNPSFHSGMIPAELSQNIFKVVNTK